MYTIIMGKLIRSSQFTLILLLLGASYAWYMNISKIILFYDFYGTMNKFTQTIFPNPFITPCFYGGIAFLLSLYLVYTKNRYAKALLIASSIFAWGNWTWGIIQYYVFKSDSFTCSGASVNNPFITPCFIGALFFTSALVHFTLISKKTTKHKKRR